MRSFRASAGRVAGLLGAGLGTAAAIGGLESAVTAAADFDQTMRMVARVTETPTTAMKELRAVALDMGAKTSFSAKQASDAMLELGKGGMSFAQMKAGALQSTLTLAAAGGLELGDAATAVVTGLKAFGLQADHAADVAAALAGAANASVANVDDMGLALAQVGQSARSARLTIQQTAGALAIFADNGIRGSDAGTSLKTMLQRLIPTTAKAKETMADLGLKFTDAKGQMLPITEIAQRLQDKLSGLSDAQRTAALNTIFGSDAIRAATILMREGRSGLEKYIAATSDRSAAEQLAKTRTEGAAGALERMRGAIETVSIRIGDKLLPAVANMADGIGNAVTAGFDALESSVPVESFTRAAKAWATVIIRAFKKALKDGDWKDLGDTLKKVLSKAIGNGADLIRGLFDGVDWSELGRVLADGLAKAVGDGSSLIGTAFAGVDWVSVGKTVGGHAFGFAVGFISAFGSDLISVAREHPLDLAIFVTSFLAVGKIGGVIARVLEHVPFLRAFAPLFKGIHGLTEPVNNAIGRLVDFIGNGLGEGLGRVFPRISGVVRKGLGDMLAWFSLRAEAFRAGGARMIRNLAVGIGEQIGLVARNIGQVIRAITRPFIGAAGWLIRRGLEAISGLLRGVLNAYGRIAPIVRGVITRLRSPFDKALGWLSRAGQNLVDGLISGIRAALGSVGSVLSDLKDTIVGGIKRLFGIGSPSKVMAGLGGHMVAGLVRGLLTNRSSLQAVLKSIGGNMLDWFSGSLGGLLGIFGGGGGGGGASGPIAALVKNMAAALYGWTGSQWSALSRLLMGESGFNPNAQNPTSTAYGLFQFLNSTWAGVGARKTADPGGQTVAGLRYIAQVYGSPIRALAAWMSRTPHWYAKGGIFTQPSIIGVGEAGTEAVVPLNRAKDFGFGGGSQVVVQLHFHGPVIGGQRAADELAALVHEALKKRKRDVFGGRALGIA